MKNNAYLIRNYTFKPTDNLLFDANIWLFIYGPQGNPSDLRSQIYSNALAQAIKAKSHLYIDVLVLSEFINRYARLRHNLLRAAGKASDDFKTFRSSAIFKPIAKDIADDTRRLMRQCVRAGSRFESVDIDTILNEYEQGKSDFNDQILAALCRAEGLTLVTHDADFKNRGLRVLTANNRLLS